VTGTKVRVRGNEADAAITVDLDPASVTVVQAADTVPQMRRAVVLLVDFIGDATGTGAGAVSCTDAQVADMMYTRLRSSGGNFDDNYKATSYDQVAWDPNTDGFGSADVFRVSIGASVSDSCDNSFGSWADQADSAATAAGIDLSLYRHHIYVVPDSTNC